MALELAIPKQLATAVSSLRELSDEAADQLIEALRLTAVWSFEELHDTVEQVTGDAEQAQSISVALLNLVHLRRLHLASPEELRLAVSDAMERQTDERWSGVEVERWNQLGPKLDRLLSTNSLHALEKVLDLRYNHENVLGRARLITELQPVFGEAVDEIQTFLVAHTLRLEFTRANRGETLSLALDDQDIDLLRRECERAVEKAKAVRSQLAERKLNVVPEQEVRAVRK
jgi:hypothetical protein